jgi:hypothetical protein
VQRNHPAHREEHGIGFLQQGKTSPNLRRLGWVTERREEGGDFGSVHVGRRSNVYAREFAKQPV